MLMSQYDQMQQKHIENNKHNLKTQNYTNIDDTEYDINKNDKQYRHDI